MGEKEEAARPGAEEDGVQRTAAGAVDGADGRMDEETTCPSCFRFVGTYEKCPYCGAEVYKRMSVRLFRWGSLVFSFVGLLLLWLAARGIQAPLVRIGDLEPTMSMGMVRVRGRVLNEPRLHPEWHSLYVQVGDPSGTVAVNAYREVAEAIMGANPPARGDLVEVQGMLRFQSGGGPPRLLCQSPAHFRITMRAPEPAPPSEVALRGIDEGMEGKPVRVRGRLAEASVLSFGAYRGVLKDRGGSVVIWLDPSRWKSCPTSVASRLLSTGSALRVDGTVVVYRNRNSGAKVLEIVPFGRKSAVAPDDGVKGRGGSR